MHVLSKPTGREKIPEGTLAYLKTRNRLKAFSYIWGELEKSGLSKAELADRLGKGTDRIAHLLGAPGNWTLDTLTELAFAICAATVDYKSSFPLDKPARNQNFPSWLFPDPRPTLGQKKSLPLTTIPMASVGKNVSSPFTITYTGTSTEGKCVNKVFEKVNV